MKAEGGKDNFKKFPKLLQQFEKQQYVVVAAVVEFQCRGEFNKNFV